MHLEKSFPKRGEWGYFESSKSIKVSNIVLKLSTKAIIEEWEELK
jgi:hypothetical protein